MKLKSNGCFETIKKSLLQEKKRDKSLEITENIRIQTQRAYRVTSQGKQERNIQEPVVL